MNILHLLKKIEFKLFLLWSFTIFFIELNFIFYIFSLVAILKIIVLKEYRKKIFIKENITFLLILGFVCCNIISLTYSNNFYEGIKRIEKLLPLIFISIIGLYANKQVQNSYKSQELYLYGGLFSVLVSTLYTCYEFYNGNLKAIAFNKGIEEINFLNFFEHRLYIGILILMLIPMINNKIFNAKKIIIIIIWSLVMLILLFIIYSTGARLLILLFVLLSILSIFKELKNKIKKVILYPVVGIVSIILISIIYLHPRTNLTIYLIKNGKNLHKVDSRVNTWSSAYELWKENYIFGVGLGDASKKLIEKYQKNEYRLEYENEYNAHNQFLETSIQTGIIGLLLLCSILLTLLYSRKKNPYIYDFLIIIVASFMIESVLNRNLGTIGFAYWIFLLTTYKTDSKNIKEHNNVKFLVLFISLSIISLTSIYLYSKIFVFNPERPNTYLAIPFEELQYKNLPKKSQLPRNTNAALINNKKAFKKFEYGYYLAPEIYSGSYKDTVNVEFGIWCYISKESNIRRLYVYGWDKINTEYKSSYDFERKGSWQYLELNKMKFSGNFATGVRMDLYRETINLKGQVLLALPSYSLDKNIP
ncbi:O-antigen ligase family protein [Cellulophaga baltica]|uniref:O-antigen ligase family protein n=1 Tax=Cellulophaga baltica TaxID=76594 RepID=UPI00041BCA3B|nr:O-antigen ligase family protein [Cellulophaga baltica]MBA6313761.1 hypothetical protein [Cellulophaga baltica]